MNKRKMSKQDDGEGDKATIRIMAQIYCIIFPSKRALFELSQQPRD